MTVASASGNGTGAAQPLAYTGVDISEQLAMAFSVLLAGLLLLGFARRRRL